MDIRLLTIALITLLATACTNGEIEMAEEQPNTRNDSDNYYISLHISTPASSGSRADNSSAYNYEEGSEAENDIQSIRFFFFKDDEKAAIGKESDDSPIYYIDWEPSLSGEDKITSNSANVEVIYNVLLELNPDEELKPTQVIAIVNPTLDLKKLTDISLEGLRNMVYDFQSNLTDHNFVMSNSSYIKTYPFTNNQQLVSPVDIIEANWSHDPKVASNNPVLIHVERVVARIDLNFSNDIKTEKDNVYTTTQTYVPDGENEEQEIFVKLLGWAVTSTPKSSRLLKAIDENWDTEKFFSTGYSWNSENDHRSFWAINPEGTDSSDNYTWVSFNQTTGNGSGEVLESNCYDMNVTTAYMQENANPFTVKPVTLSNPSYSTKVIVGGQLIDKDGEPVIITEYDSQYFSISSLKSFIASKLDMYFISTENVENTVLTPVTGDDIEFETAKNHGKDFGPDAEDMFYVYYKLSESGKNKTWYHKFTDNTQKESSEITNPEEYINQTVFPAKVWLNGYTYYFFEIPHCQQIEPGEPGYYGVVRNHLYNATVERILGLGTPVFNPDDIIYPEKPESGKTPIIVKVSTLKWRLESQDVQLSW